MAGRHRASRSCPPRRGEPQRAGRGCHRLDRGGQPATRCRDPDPVRFWHRASFDGYGEKADGSEWQPTPTGSGITHGRGWPLLTGERGEYQLAAGSDAQNYLDTIAPLTARAGCSRNRCGTTSPRRVQDRASNRASRPSPPPRSPGPSTTARRSRPRNRSPAATQARSAAADTKSRRQHEPAIWQAGQRRLASGCRAIRC
jgi:hypothetical protein